MRILFIAPYVPSLIRVRPYNWIKFLALLGHEVTVAALGTDGAERDSEARQALVPLCRAVHVVPHTKGQAALQCAVHLLSPTPLWAAYCFSPAMQRLLRRLASAQAFDVVHVEHLRAAHFGQALLGNLPVVFDAVDCLADLQHQMRLSPGRSAAARLVSWEEELKLRRYEPRLAARFARTLITSRTDADALRALARVQGTDVPLSVVPNGVDLEYFQPQPGATQTGRHVVFSGKMGYAANHDAALYFASDIWPRVQAAHPDATLTIAGNGPRAELRALAASPQQNIAVTGHVPDLRPFLSRATVAVCPLRIGVGIQNKALEAMAMGRAVVATPLAARALEPDAPGRVLHVANGAKPFADAVIHLLARPEEARALGAEARCYVETHHDWRRLAAQVAEIYGEAMQAFSQNKAAQKKPPA